jgi:acyl-CoA reductase-like NAD-dependent aldehyde dehydrogenase
MSEIVSSGFDKEVLELLRQTRNLLEEVLETLDILADEEMMNAIRESEDEIRRGATRDFKVFVKELDLKDEL